MILKCLLITDTATAKALTGFIETTGTLSLQAHTASVEDALPEIEKSMPDIILLGVEQYYLLKNAVAGREKTPVFICLVPEDYASDLPSSPVLAIGVGQLSYELFLHTVNRAIVQLLNPANLVPARGESWFFIKSEYRMVKVNFEDILFCEGLKDYTQIYTSKKSKPIITLQNLKTFLDRLPPAGFVRIHRSYIVALNHIESISKKEVEIGEKIIPIGNSYRNNLLDIVKLYS
jgi:hypothetical protein